MASPTALARSWCPVPTPRRSLEQSTDCLRERLGILRKQGVRIVLIVDDDPRFLATAERRWGSGRTRLPRARRAASERADSRGRAMAFPGVDRPRPARPGRLFADQRTAGGVPRSPRNRHKRVVQKVVLDSARLLGASDALPKPIDAGWG